MITIFSKDRPDRLKRTLPQFAGSAHEVVLLDDSLRADNRLAIQRLCRDCGVAYHGANEQALVFAELAPGPTRRFLGRLSSQAWNLGHNRNYAVVLALFHGAEQLLLLDDDILFRDSASIDELLGAVDRNPFVGTTITGMPDHSVVGHLYEAARVPRSTYTSGSCLALNPKVVQHYFLNRYNEDWIWLLLEREGRPVPQIFPVEQLPYEPFTDLGSRPVFQEFGEILWEGMFLGYQAGAPERLLAPEFWEKVLDLRLDDIAGLPALNLPEPLRAHAARVSHTLLGFIPSLHPTSFVELIKDYYRDLPLWREFVSEIAEKTSPHDRSRRLKPV